jgi:predicted enzyme related to lactoylglutathione lyase
VTKNSDESVADHSTGVDVDLQRPGCISYLHIPAVDVRAAALFYQTVFGWQIMNIDSGRPSFVDRSGSMAGAWMTDQAVSAQPGLLPYLYVDNVDDTVAHIAAHGGSIVSAPAPEGNLRIATFRDPAGNVLGVWQATEG